MPSNNQPDVTAPVSSVGRSRFLGVAGNLYGGTTQAGTDPNGNQNNLGAGAANQPVGGVVYRPAGQSSNQFPVSPATTVNTNSGSAPSLSTGSSNPANIQAQTEDRVSTEVVAQTTPALVSTPAAGSLINFPKTTETADFGSSSSVKSNVTLNRQQPANAYVGITATNANGNANDLEVLADERRVVQDTNVVIQGRIDGASNVNLAAVYPSGVQMYNPSDRELPGGVSDSSDIG